MDSNAVFLVLVVVGAYVLVGIPLIILTVYAITWAYHKARSTSWMNMLQHLRRRRNETDEGSQ